MAVAQEKVVAMEGITQAEPPVERAHSGLDEVVTSRLLLAVHRGDLTTAERLLRRTGAEVIEMRDSRGYTALHISCLNSNSDMTKLLVDTIRRLPGVDNVQLLKDWANKQTEEGFTCLHFASFRGDMELLRVLMETGANVQIKNKQGLSALHVAAQGNQPAALALLLQMGLSLNDTDDKGSTPLHWATFLRSELAVHYLLSWGADPNQADSEGMTPLHLAATAGNYKIVKQLLLKGARTDALDKQGKSAQMLATQHGHDNIVKLLTPTSSVLAACNIRPRPAPVTEPFLPPLLVFWIGFIAAHAAAILFILPYVGSDALAVIFLLTSLLTVLFHALTWLSDPGYLHRSKLPLVELLEKHDVYLVCPECQAVKPERTRHCHFCKRCVMRFDHHCPWVNNCIGIQNHGLFFTFICCFLLDLILCIVVSIILFVGESSPPIDWLSTAVTGWEGRKYIALALVIVAGSLFIPASLLWVVHVRNVCTNMTTGETCGHNYSLIKDDSSNSKSRFDRGSARKNCKEMCCGSTSSDYREMV
eukprot:GILK01005968.1.p1 GENE.GILK01005968.1~~GILK01005968.1.p1  ORF type:complete len:550 (+),score=89.42 GILK01005968.1:52-1650(+)